MSQQITLSQSAHDRILNIITDIVSKYKRTETIDLNDVISQFLSHPELPKSYKFSHDRLKKPMLTTIKILVRDRNERAKNMSDEDRRHCEMFNL